MATMLLIVTYLFLLSCTPVAAVAFALAVWVAKNWTVDWVPIVEAVFFWGALAGIAAAFLSPY